MTWNGKVYSLYSDDDGVIVFVKEKDAKRTRRGWEAAGAHALSEVKEHDMSDLIEPKPNVIVEMEGGLIQEIWSDSGRVRVEVIDHDCHPESKYAPEAETQEELWERWNGIVDSVKDLVPYNAKDGSFGLKEGGFRPLHEQQGTAKSQAPMMWEVTKRLAEYLLEVHQDELTSKHGGDSKEKGERPDECSYCRAIADARLVLDAWEMKVGMP